MPTDTSEKVAESLATEAPADEGEEAADAARVEQSVPQPVEAATEPIVSWADASEDIFAPEPSLEGTSAAADTDRAEGHLLEVKQEEFQEAASLGAVLSAIGVPEEVADEVATDPTDQVLEPAKVDPNEVPAEAAFADLDRVKEEGQDRTAGEPLPLAEQADPETETADLLGLGDDPGPVGEASVASEPSASVPEPTVADPSGVATEANSNCPDQIVPPPTSPNLVDPGAEPIQVGHSPAGPSRRPRVRSSRGGATTRWQEAKRGWWADFEAYQNWLYRNSGGDIARGFWLPKISYENATEDQRWVIALHSRIVEKLTTSQCLALAYYIFETYQRWARNYGLDRRRGTAHTQQVIDSGDLPPKRRINQLVLGAEHPRVEEWDCYFRYIGPQQQPRPKAERAAAATAVAGAPSGSEPLVPVPKGPKEPTHPPPGWQPTLRSVNHPAQVPAPTVTVSVRSVPTAAKSDSQGVAASGRDVAAFPAASPVTPPKARPKAPDSNTATLADRIRSLPPAPTSIAPSPPQHKQPPLPPPSTPPPGDSGNLPPPPSHPPPTAQELAAREAQQAEAREEAVPADPNDPPEEEEQEWVVEEEEEEEAFDVDEIVEVEAEAEEEEPEFPDFVTTERGREVSTRRRRPKRNRSDPPVPVNLIPRETRERIELNREIFRARQETGVSRRPLALRPQVHGYPEIRIDAAGTWARVADPPVAYAPQTLPYIVPRGENQYPELAVNPHDLPDSVWRDPALRPHRTILGSSNLDPNSVFNISVDNPTTESEGSETAETRTARFVSSAEAYVAEQEPVEAGFADHTPSRPRQSPPKRARPNIRISQVQRDKPLQPRKETPSVAQATPTVPSLNVPTLSSSSSSAYPWAHPLQGTTTTGAADTSRVAAETVSEPAASPTARSRSRAPSAETAPAVAAARPRGRETTVSNKVSSRAPKRASSVPALGRKKGAAVPDTPQRPEPLPPSLQPKKKLPFKNPPIVPPRPTRPAPPNPANLKPFKQPPPGVPKAKTAGEPTKDLPPLDPDQPQQHPEQEQSSGSGLAPSLRGKPLPAPSPDRPEGVAGTVPRHYQHQPNLVSRVIHIDAANVVVCVDWHDTLDQALNPIGELSSRLVEKLRSLVRAAGNRIKFHIVSYAGASKVESTKEGAQHVIDQLVREGLPFKELHLAWAPCGRQGKASIVSALQAHCLIDDRSDILNESKQLGIKTVRAEGRRDKELTWVAEVEDWLRYEGVEHILQHRRPIPLRPEQWYPAHGGKDNPALW